LELKDSEFRGHRGNAVVIEAKAVEETGEFEGHGSVFDVEDQGADIIVRGAFAESLNARPMQSVKMLWQHDTHCPIGRWMELREDDRGLYCKGKLFLAVQAGREAHELMREGAVDGLSIGYTTKRYEIDRDNQVRKLLEVDLREISVVTFPMNEAATVSLVKAGQLPTERELEDWLKRDAGFSSSQAKAIIANGFKSLKNERDAGNSEERLLTEAMQRLAQRLRG
jgi:HK97 family phage prohead protease